MKRGEFYIEVEWFNCCRARSSVTRPKLISFSYSISKVSNVKHVDLSILRLNSRTILYYIQYIWPFPSIMEVNAFSSAAYFILVDCIIQPDPHSSWNAEWKKEMKMSKFS